MMLADLSTETRATAEESESMLALERSVRIQEERDPLAASIGIVRGLLGSTVLWVLATIGFLYFR